MTKGRVTALWVLTAAVLTAAQIANGVSGTTAYYTDSHQMSISGTNGTWADTTGPVFTAPADQSIEATEAAGAVASWTTPAATDAVDGAVPVTCLPSSGSVFPIGVTTVTCTSTDAAHNTTTHTFTITVVATGAPVIAPHDPVTAEATGPSGATVTYDVPATSDAVDGTVVATCLPASGSLFPLGATTVLCDAVDTAGNHAVQTKFTVTVRDTTPPAFTAPENRTIPATSSAGAVASWTTPAAADLVDGTSDAVACLPASGSTFPIGVTTVTCTSTDAAHNTTTHTFTITVVATGAPVITPHGPVTAEATGPTGAIVPYTAPATSDAVDGTGVATCAPASGSLFPLGTTTVKCDAVDAAGNHAAQTHFTVTVRDTTPPVFTAPADQAIPATGPSGAVASWTTPPAADLVDGTDPVTCLPASGSTFPVGVTTVTCTSTDAAHNTTTHTFTITVVVTSAPVAAPTQAPAANANGWNNTDVVVAWHWSSAASAIDTAHCTTTSTSSGQGTLTLTATCANVAGVTGSASYTVKVDKTKPLVAITGHPTNPGSSSSAAFTFSATDTGGSGIATQTCKLDGGPAMPCATATSQGYTGLTAGSHTFTIVATDLAGNSSQATYTWCIAARGPSISVGHAADGSNGWNRTAPVSLVIKVTPGAAAVANLPACTDNGHPLTVTGSSSPYAAAVSGEGTHAITCRVTDVAGASTTGTDAVKVDTVSPAVTIPADITAGTPDPAGAVIRYTTAFTDATSGLARTACSPASGSRFPIGVTTVTCTATDKAGNSRSRSFSIAVTIQAAIPAKQAVLASLRAELACTASRDVRNRLSDAIRHLEDSLVASLWVTSGPLADGNHLDPINGDKVFDAEHAAVDALAGIIRPSTAVRAAITQLATVDQFLAQTSIDDAVAAHADPAKIRAARQEMANAQADVAKGRFSLAIAHWKNAWDTVTAPPAP